MEQLPSLILVGPSAAELRRAGKVLRDWRRANVTLFPTQKTLAECLERGEAWLSGVLAGRIEVPAELSLLIHGITNGAVPGSLTRPDIWRRPEDVPVERLKQKRGGS